jgi:hypothetical protein
MLEFDSALCFSHANGSVAAIYNRYGYLREMRGARSAGP